MLQKEFMIVHGLKDTSEDETKTEISNNGSLFNTGNNDNYTFYLYGVDMTQLPIKKLYR